jgi:glutaredoxin/glutathione-dependent peroxiredoxin
MMRSPGETGKAKGRRAGVEQRRAAAYLARLSQAQPGVKRMTIKVGDKIPDVPIAIATSDGPKPTTTGEFFNGRKVALFAVPGAFTPTCSARHLPSFVEKAGELKDKGVDEIACIAVNDPFVMAAWGAKDGSKDITMIADGNGQFAQAAGLDMDASKFGMGQRSQRYSMVVDDCIVEQLNVEAPGEYRASSAEHLLEQL